MSLLEFFRGNRRSASESGHLSDREACQGADGLTAAVNWMRHVLRRDSESKSVRRCVVIVELEDGEVIYTAHSVDATPVEVFGLLEVAREAAFLGDKGDV